MSVQLIICGMHRSGTSLVSNVMREAGLALVQSGETTLQEINRVTSLS